MSKLLKRTKAIVSKSRQSGALSGKEANRLRQELRAPGVSDVERKLRKTVVKSLPTLDVSPARKAVRQQFRKQARASAHPNQGGSAPSSHTSTSSYKKRG